MELKDIVLKKGDIVYFEPQGKYPTCFIFSGNKECRTENYCERLMADDWCPKITKIERPIEYETIYEAPKEILDKEEKEYLEELIQYFGISNRISLFTKLDASSEFLGKREYIRGICSDGTKFALPNFEKDTMYKNMELNKEYTLEELGLFKE